jgi:hypothetical protein
MKGGRRQKRCRKNTYRDQREALHFLAVVRRNAAALGQQLPERAYRCPRYGGWHLTSQTLQERHGPHVPPGAGHTIPEEAR